MPSLSYFSIGARVKIFFPFCWYMKKSLRQQLLCMHGNSLSSAFHKSYACLHTRFHYESVAQRCSNSFIGKSWTINLISNSTADWVHFKVVSKGQVAASGRRCYLFPAIYIRLSYPSITSEFIYARRDDKQNITMNISANLSFEFYPLRKAFFAVRWH